MWLTSSSDKKSILTFLLAAKRAGIWTADVTMHDWRPLVPRGTSTEIWPCWCNTNLSNQNTSSRQQLRGTVGGGYDLRNWTWFPGTGRVPVPVLPQTDLDGLLYLRFQLPLFVRWGGSALNGCQQVWKRYPTCGISLSLKTEEEVDSSCTGSQVYEWLISSPSMILLPEATCVPKGFLVC